MGTIKYKIAHIGINGENAEEALSIAKLFSEVFCLPTDEGTRSVFVGADIEVMKGPYLGRLGHIAMGTPDCETAIKDLQSRGYDVDMSTASYNQDGSLKAVYLNKEIGGFAVHIIKQPT